MSSGNVLGVLLQEMMQDLGKNSKICLWQGYMSNPKGYVWESIFTKGKSSSLLF